LLRLLRTVVGTTRKFSLVQQLRQLSGVQETWWTRRLQDRLWPKAEVRRCPNCE